ncbi:MAG: regulatory protein RecX [Gallionella sp.]|nr:regulatory protein RecX [Gallionella sp.]
MKKNADLRTRALRYLARREYTRTELEAKLRPCVQNESESEQVSLDALLDDLTTSGYLSDERAARQLLHAKRSRFGVGRIVHELRLKGVSEELIAQLLPSLQEGEAEVARGVWQKKFGALPQPSKARQLRFMQSRGFGFEVVADLLLFAEDDG